MNYDTSKIGLGCLLMQNDKVITYGSRQLKVHKRYNPNYNFELAIVVFSLNI